MSATTKDIIAPQPLDLRSSQTNRNVTTPSEETLHSDQTIENGEKRSRYKKRSDRFMNRVLHNKAFNTQAITDEMITEVNRIPYQNLPYVTNMNPVSTLPWQKSPYVISKIDNLEFNDLFTLTFFYYKFTNVKNKRKMLDSQIFSPHFCKHDVIFEVMENGFVRCFFNRKDADSDRQGLIRLVKGKKDLKISRDYSFFNFESLLHDEMIRFMTLQENAVGCVLVQTLLDKKMTLEQFIKEYVENIRIVEGGLATTPEKPNFTTSSILDPLIVSTVQRYSKMRSDLYYDDIVQCIDIPPMNVFIHRPPMNIFFNREDDTTFNIDPKLIRKLTRRDKYTMLLEMHPAYMESRITDEMIDSVKEHPFVSSLNTEGLLPWQKFSYVISKVEEGSKYHGLYTLSIFYYKVFPGHKIPFYNQSVVLFDITDQGYVLCNERIIPRSLSDSVSHDEFSALCWNDMITELASKWIEPRDNIYRVFNFYSIEELVEDEIIDMILDPEFERCVMIQVLLDNKMTLEEYLNSRSRLESDPWIRKIKKEQEFRVRTTGELGDLQYIIKRENVYLSILQSEHEFNKFVNDPEAIKNVIQNYMAWYKTVIEKRAALYSIDKSQPQENSRKNSEFLVSTDDTPPHLSPVCYFESINVIERWYKTILNLEECGKIEYAKAEYLLAKYNPYLLINPRTGYLFEGMCRKLFKETRKHLSNFYNMSKSPEYLEYRIKSFLKTITCSGAGLVGFVPGVPKKYDPVIVWKNENSNALEEDNELYPGGPLIFSKSKNKTHSKPSQELDDFVFPSLDSFGSRLSGGD